MNRNFRIKATGITGILFLLFYFALLGDSGFLRQNDLKNTLHWYENEVQTLESENLQLEHKKKILKSDEVALEIEARKFYLLSEKAKILKFSEERADLQRQKDEPLLASRIPRFHDNRELSLPPMVLLRFFYISFAIFVTMGVFLKSGK